MIYGPLIIISIVFAGVGFLLSSRLKGKFARYSRMSLGNGLSGAEVAAAMLRDNGITDVRITQSPGQLSDHYNPADKTVNLSPDVFQGRNVAAAAVAAHEVGHAVQHARAYAGLKLRSALVPIVSVSARLQQYIFMLGFVLIGAIGSDLFLMIAIAAFGVTAAFALVTLPVEFDASNRALAWLDSSGVASGAQHAGAKDALWWAAMTYVAAALSAVAQLAYLVFYFLGSRD